MRHLIKEEGIAGAQKLMREERELQNNITIGVAGMPGVGKSSFINAIRGIKDEDENAAKTGVVETTLEPTRYTFPDHPKIVIVDLPAYGTPSSPHLNIFCKKVPLQDYDVFFILTAGILTEIDIEFAKKIRAMEKRFFLIRTKIDQDEMNEKRHKNCDIDAMLANTQAQLYESVKDLQIRKDNIFVISNTYTEKLDFKRLFDTTTKMLPASQKTQFLMTLSKDIVLEKVQRLQGGTYCCFPFRSILVKPFTTIKVLRDREFNFIGKKVATYRSALGFPLENSEEFKVLDDVLQNKVKRFYFTSEMNVASLVKELNTECGYDTASGDSLPWLYSYRILHNVLDEMKETGMEIIEFTAAKYARDNDMTK